MFFPHALHLHALARITLSKELTLYCILVHSYILFNFHCPLTSLSQRLYLITYLFLLSTLF